MRSLSFLLASCFVLQLGCGTDYVSTREPHMTLLPSPTEQERVRAAIVYGMNERNFSAVKEEPGLIEARYDRGDEMIHVAIIYDDRHFDIKYVNSAGLKFDPDAPGGANGDLRIEETYRKLVERLAREITERLEEQDKPAYAAAAPAPAPAAQNPGEPVGTPTNEPAPAPAPAVDPAAAAFGIGTQILNQVAPPAPVNVQQNTTVKQSDQQHRCCINGAYYECPNQEAFQACFTEGPGECKRVQSKDGSCN